uniref:F-box domain-containing protein n=1 Tax=Oncorhynchus tshawytscha TaxID=74940 RepID=A0A8C8I641_ONCTS
MRRDNSQDRKPTKEYVQNYGTERMSRSSDSDDGYFVAMDTEEDVSGPVGMAQGEDLKLGTSRGEGDVEGCNEGEGTMVELPEEVLEYILSFLSPYQEHKTAALVCKQWYRLIKGACYYDSNQSMYVFGGCTQSSCNAAFNDLWRLDLNSKEWIRPLASGSYPSPKAGATLVMYNNLLVLFGGWTRPSPYPLHQPERFFDEIHTYSPSKNWWNCIVTTQGPLPMAGHSSSVIGSDMVVFGGSLGARQMSNEVWVLDLEQWSWSKPTISGPSPHPRGGQSQIVIDNKTLLILGGCGGPNALLKDAWLLHMGAPPWTWQQLRVENDDHGAPELWCHPACRVGQCVVVFSQAPSGRAPLSPSLNSRPSPISASPGPLGPEPPSLRSQSPLRSGAAGVVLGAVEEAPCVNGRWGTLRPRPSARGGAREGSPGSSPQQPSPSQGPDSPPLPSLHPLLNGSSPSPRTSPAQDASPPSRPPVSSDYGWESPPSATHPLSEVPSTNGVHTPPPAPDSPRTPPGAVSPAALRRGLEAVKNLSSSSSSNPLSQGAASGGSGGGVASAGTSPSSSPPQAAAAGSDGHSIPPIARRLGHHPPQSLNVGKPLYQSLNCKPMQMYVLDVSRAKAAGLVSWRVYGNGTPAAVTGPPETSLHTVVQGRGELIIFGGLMDKKQNVKYYPKTNALYFVRAKR